MPLRPGLVAALLLCAACGPTAAQSVTLAGSMGNKALLV
jgi:hypothetical protein